MKLTFILSLLLTMAPAMAETRKKGKHTGDNRSPDSAPVRNRPLEKGMHGKEAQEAVKRGEFEVEEKEMRRKQRSF